jgi:hypothetical protein
MRIFVPIEDASIDNEAGVLVPYRYGLTCAHELRGALVLRDGVWSECEAINANAINPGLINPGLINDGSSIRRPASVPACSPGLR